MNKREWMLQTVTAWYGRGHEMRVTVTAAGLAEELSVLYDAIVAATPEPADEGWIEHRGEKPYPEGRVTVQLRNGNTFTGDADNFIWSRGDFEEPDEDIIAWRPARA